VPLECTHKIDIVAVLSERPLSDILRRTYIRRQHSIGLFT